MLCMPFRPLLALSLFFLATPGRALTTYCVHDAAELYSALVAAQNSSDTPVIVNIRKGTYNAADAAGAFNLVQVHSNQLVAVSGGWSGDIGECTQHSNDASDTVLVGTATRRTLKLATSNANPNVNNTLYVSDLTLRNPAGGDVSSCLDLKVTPGNSVTANRLQIDQCVAQDSSFSTVAGF